MTALNPYISFRGNAREALEFYHAALGGRLDVLTFGMFPDMPHDPAEDDLVMHGHLKTEEGLTLMGSDTPASMEYAAPRGISVSFSSDDSARVHAVWDALSDGATITQPLAPPMWGGEFGMLVDRFGTAWMFSVDAPTP